VRSDPASRTLVGAAAAGTDAAADPAPAPEPPSRAERAFCLRPGETVADGIRRAARGRLADGSDALAGASGRDELGSAVHEARKSIKRARATLRLARGAIGEMTYEHENAAMQAIAGRLSGARDAHVLIQTLDAIEQRFAAELPPDATERLGARLHDEHERAVSALVADGDVAVTTRAALEEARARTRDWSFASDGFAAVEPGLRRVYRRGRKRLRAAEEEPSAENLHDARKRVKDLWHAAELLQAAHPKRMKRLAGDAHELSSLLGDHHDLHVLRAYAAANPQLFSDMQSREELLAAVDRRSDELAGRALEHGRRLYKRSPKRFVRTVARGWDKRVATG
jgi:CHAD domain-containing protein